MVTGTGLAIFATILTIAALIKDGALEKVGLGHTKKELIALAPCNLDQPMALPTKGNGRLEIMYCKRDDGKPARPVSFLFREDRLQRIEVALKGGLEAATAAKALDARHAVDTVPGNLTSVQGFACRKGKVDGREVCRRSWDKGRFEIVVGETGLISLRHQQPSS